MEPTWEGNGSLMQVYLAVKSIKQSKLQIQKMIVCIVIFIIIFKCKKQQTCVLWI